MDDLGTFVEKKFAVSTALGLEAVAERLARPSEYHSISEPPKQDGRWYSVKINYRDVGSWVPIDVWAEQAENKIIFSILVRYRDGRSERHILNGVAKLLEEVCIGEEALLKKL